MRVCFVEVGHWHAPYYYRGAAAQGVQVAAVSDRRREVAERVAGELGCRSYTDYRTMVERERPDFVFSLGRHCDMAGIARYLLDRGVPFGMEKPMGLTSAEVAPLVEQARRQGAFAAVPLTFRRTPWVQRALELEGPGLDFAFTSFRFITGPISRYFEAGSEWILNRPESGGGCTLNLGIHFTDLFKYLTRKRPVRLWATMNNHTNGIAVEDYSCVIMETEDGTSCRIETGYALPSMARGPGLECMLRGPHGLYEVHENEAFWIGPDGRLEAIPGPTGQTHFYGSFLAECLSALREGRPPLATLEDNYEAFKLVEAAYKAVETKQVVEL